MIKQISVILVLLLLLTGCQPSQKIPADDGTTTQRTTEDSSEDVNVDSSKDANADSSGDTPVPQPLKAGDTGSSTYAPDHLYPFVYSGDSPHPWHEVDTSECVVGNLYVENENTGVVTEIINVKIVCYEPCNEFILYVTEREPQKVWRTDYTGSSHTVVYEAAYGDITQVTCYDNVGEKEQLATLEGGTHIVLYDLATTQSQVLMTQQDIDHFDLSLYGRQGLVGIRKKDWTRWYYDTATGELMEDTSL